MPSTGVRRTLSYAVLEHLAICVVGPVAVVAVVLRTVAELVVGAVLAVVGALLALVVAIAIVTIAIVTITIGAAIGGGLGGAAGAAACALIARLVVIATGAALAEQEAWASREPPLENDRLHLGLGYRTPNEVEAADTLTTATGQILVS